MEQMTNRKYLILLAVLLLITASSAVIPASWFGIGAKKNEEASDLTSIKTINLVGTSKDGSPSTWKDLAEQAFKDQPDLLTEIKSTPVDQKDLTLLNDPNNLTASFSKNLFVATTYLNQNGGGDDATKQEILDQLTAQEAEKIIPTTYLFKNLNVAKAESKDSIKSYGNNLASILENLITETSIKNDMEGIADYLNTGNLKSVNVIVSDYQKVNEKLKKLLALSVPLSASTYHLIVVNQVASYRDNLYNLSQLVDDPLRSRIALEKYPDTAVSTLTVYKTFSNYFNTKNIIFSAKDSGYVFTAGYTIK